MSGHIEGLNYALGKPQASGTIRKAVTDFQVTEELGFELTGEGEHQWLWVEKSGANTEWVARELSRFAGIAIKNVGYSGLKDRHAVTRQWFSLPVVDKDWQELVSDEFTILQVARHQKKLKRGAHKRNQFRLMITDLVADREELLARLEKIQVQGVPNYFGPQRFGHNENNVTKALAWCADEIRPRSRQNQSLWLSALRSLLFNEILSERVATKCWAAALPGDCMMLEGSNSVFVAPTIDDEITTRIAAADIHPTAPLWGVGGFASSDKAAELESRVLSPYEAQCNWLEQQKLKLSRRSCRLMAQQFEWRFVDEDRLELTFSLESGAYATAILREIVDV